MFFLCLHCVLPLGSCWSRTHNDFIWILVVLRFLYFLTHSRDSTSWTDWQRARCRHCLISKYTWEMRICDYRPPHLWNIRASRLKNLRCIPTSQTSQQPLAMMSEEWILWPLLIKEFRWLLVPYQVWNWWLLLSRISIQWHGSITCDCWWHQMESPNSTDLLIGELVLIFRRKDGGRSAWGYRQDYDDGPCGDGDQR